MSSIAHKRKESLVFQEVSQIITTEINNSNIYSPTVTEVKLSNDQSHLIIYVSFLKHIQKSLENINKVKGFIKHKLAKLNCLRIIPEIVFKIDDSIEKGQRIEKILKDIKKNN